MPGDRGALLKEPEGGPAERRSWRRGFLPALAAVVLLATGFGYWRFARSVRGPGPLRATPLTAYPGREVHPSFSPDGSQIAFSWSGERQENNDIYVQVVGPGAPLRLTTDAATDESPVWSPDGRWIAFLRFLPHRKSGVFLIPALGGPERKIAEVAARPSVTGPFLTWTPDGRNLIASDQEAPGRPHGLFLFAIDSGERRRLTTPPPTYAGDLAPAITADGRRLAFVRYRDVTVSDLWLQELSADLHPRGEPQRLTFEERHTASPAWTPEDREILFSSGAVRAGRALWRLRRRGQGSRRRRRSACRWGKTA